jgi:hypothetical protein
MTRIVLGSIRMGRCGTLRRVAVAAREGHGSRSAPSAVLQSFWTQAVVHILAAHQKRVPPCLVRRRRPCGVGYGRASVRGRVGGRVMERLHAGCRVRNSVWRVEEIRNTIEFHETSRLVFVFVFVFVFGKVFVVVVVCFVYCDVGCAFVHWVVFSGCAFVGYQRRSYDGKQSVLTVTHRAQHGREHANRLPRFPARGPEVFLRGTTVVRVSRCLERRVVQFHGIHHHADQ